MNRRSFIQMVSAAAGLFGIRQVHAFGSTRERCAADDRELEEYVNLIVDASIVPVLSNSQAVRSLEDSQRYVDTGVCRELYDFQNDHLFRVEYPYYTPWGAPPDPYDLMSNGVVFVEKPRGLPPVRKEVLRPHRDSGAKPVKISMQELLALDSDPDYQYGYGRGLDDSEESALREQEAY